MYNYKKTYIYIYIYIYIYTHTHTHRHTYIHAHIYSVVEYTDCFSAEMQDPPKECSGYDTKQSDSEILVLLELWGMQSTPSWPSLPTLLWSGVVAPDRALSMG